LRALPIELRLYNAGTISSIAVIAFLGGKHRYAAANATFMIHKSHVSFPTPTNPSRLRTAAQSLELDDARTRAILRDRLTMSDQILDDYLANELPFSAQAALDCGLIEQIRDYTPRMGQKIFNIS
jgi:ATP-dependent Clp protease protease subunit